MTVYLPCKAREAQAEVDVEVLGSGAGRVICLECGGDGNWTLYSLLSRFEFPPKCQARQDARQMRMSRPYLGFRLKIIPSEDMGEGLSTLDAPADFTIQ